jgi:hypothetical protein
MTDNADDPERSAVAAALADLRTRISVSLRAFNDASPNASWLRRSEMARITDEVLDAAARGTRRRSAPFGALRRLVSRLRRPPRRVSAAPVHGTAAGAAARPGRPEPRALASIVRIRQ